MIKTFIITSTFFLFSYAGFAQKDSVKVGIYITNLYDFNIADGSYAAEFWTWSVYKNKALTFKETQEVTKSKKTSFSNFDMEQKGALFWSAKKCTATILQDWDVRNFPFDHQKFVVNLEEVILDTTALSYVADTLNSRLSDGLSFDQWRIDTFFVKADNVRYNTTYGNPELSGASVYPSVKATIKMTRLRSWTTFFKLVTGVYVAFLISLMVFQIMPPNSDSRLGLAVGGLFAAVGNKYIVESVVPTTTQTTLIDNIHNTTFGAILAIVVMAIYISRQYYQEEELFAYKLDRRSFWGILCLYIATNIFLLIRSFNCSQC